MNNYLDINPGILKLKNRHFVFKLSSHLEIPVLSGRILLLITGDNGSGKTTFLEQIIIPQLRKQKSLFLFKGQDTYIQQIIDRCIKAIFNISLSKKKLLPQILFNSPAQNIPQIKEVPSCDIILMDETDKLLSSFQISEFLQNPDLKLIILISHNLDKLDLEQNSSLFEQVFELNITGQDAVRTAKLVKC